MSEPEKLSQETYAKVHGAAMKLWKIALTDPPPGDELVLWARLEPVLMRLVRDLKVRPEKPGPSAEHIKQAAEVSKRLRELDSRCTLADDGENECPDCDGVGWVEGGKALKSHCKICGGTGTVKRAPAPAMNEREWDVTPEMMDRIAYISREAQYRDDGKCYLSEQGLGGEIYSIVADAIREARQKERALRDSELKQLTAVERSGCESALKQMETCAELKAAQDQVAVLRKDAREMARAIGRACDEMRNGNPSTTTARGLDALEEIDADLTNYVDGGE